MATVTLPETYVDEESATPEPMYPRARQAISDSLVPKDVAQTEPKGSPSGLVTSRRPRLRPLAGTTSASRTRASSGQYEPAGQATTLGACAGQWKPGRHGQTTWAVMLAFGQRKPVAHGVGVLMLAVGQ